MNPDVVRRHLLRCASLAVLGGAAATPAWAQADSGRPVRIVVPFSAGSQTDVVARAIAKPMTASLKQNVIVENRPGASMTVGAQAVLSEAADGNNLLFVSSSYAVLPSTGLRLPYNPEKDLEAVSIVTRAALVLVASRQSGFKTIADLVNASKAKPDSLNFASSGLGSGTHLAAEFFNHAAGVKAVHIPLKGGRDMLNELLSGRVQYAFLPASDILGFVPDKITPLAATGRQRVKLVADVPTMAEAGLPSFEYYLWQALMVKAGTSSAAAERLAASIAGALNDAAVAKEFETLGIEPVRLSVAASRKFVADETAKTGAFVKQTGLKLSD
ncbi:MAG: tripartite tricarboxylate transporter substrate binding protein [Rubrivivax sp.]